VEEITLDEAMQSYLEFPLFTLPDNWNPPTDFGADDKISPSETPHGHSATRPAEEFTTHWCTSGGGDLAEQPARTSSQ